MQWIESNYEVDAVFGDGADAETQIGDAPFFIKCYRRKQSSNVEKPGMFERGGRGFRADHFILQAGGNGRAAAAKAT
jgi:diphthamide synthase (EF-2-diphthine--ammonia ligase)